MASSLKQLMKDYHTLHGAAVAVQDIHERVADGMYLGSGENPIKDDVFEGTLATLAMEVGTIMLSEHLDVLDELAKKRGKR
jgi:hypothetical protein